MHGRKPLRTIRRHFKGQEGKGCAQQGLRGGEGATSIGSGAGYVPAPAGPPRIVGAMAEIIASLKYFSGGDDMDHREYKRWKQWGINKMNVMEKLPREARGSFVWTLLQGRALEIVEHLSDSDYQKEGGDEVIFGLLDERWPQKERSDEMGEHISEIFSLKAREGETVRQWCGRARECFDRCKRKTGVAFPD